MMGRVPVRGVALLAATFCAIAGMALSRGDAFSAAALQLRREAHPQRIWAACNRNAHNSRPSTFHPLSDRAAAALVTAQREVRPDNDKPYTINGERHPAPNYYVPTASQVAAFRRARTSAGQTNVQFNPYYRYVDGRDGLHRPTTDDLIQWAAHKWGIPEDWLRAEYVQESYWNQFMLGDSTPVGRGQYGRYPSQSRVRRSTDVYQSLGITQVRWVPGGSLHSGTEPLRWLSTAFNIDYQAATLRFYYDNPEDTRSQWNDPSYRPCQQWKSLGAWFDPYPWSNSGQATYVRSVRQLLAHRVWTSTSFIGWSPPSLPPGLTLR